MISQTLLKEKIASLPNEWIYILLLILELTALHGLPHSYGDGFSGIHIFLLATITALGLTASYIYQKKEDQHQPSPLFWITYIAAGFFLSCNYFGTDHLRYIHDGKLQLAGLSPFKHLPGTGLGEAHSWWQVAINHKELTSIYPAGSQVVFILAEWLNPFSSINPGEQWKLEFGLRTFYFLSTTFFIWTHRQACLGRIFLHPLWFIACFSNLHIDAILCLIICSAALSGDHLQNRTAWLLGIATSIKWYPVIFIFALLKKRTSIKRLFMLFAAFSASLGVTHLIQLSLGFDGYFRSLMTYSRHWYFWGPFHRPLSYMFDLFNFVDPAQTARVTCMIIFLSTFLYTTFKKTSAPTVLKMFFTACLFIACSPTAHPWYYLVLLSFTPAINAPTLSYATALSLLSYSAYYEESLEPFVFVVFLVLILFLIVLNAGRKSQPHSDSKAGSRPKHQQC